MECLRYVRDGYLLHVQGSVLNGVRFDPGRLATAGPAVPLLNGIITKASIANFGVSRDGTSPISREARSITSAA